MQQAQFPAFDIGLDEIEPIEPERRDESVERGQSDEPQHAAVSPVFRHSEMGQPKAEPATALDRQGRYAESEPADRHRQP